MPLSSLSLRLAKCVLQGCQAGTKEVSGTYLRANLEALGESAGFVGDDDEPLERAGGC